LYEYFSKPHLHNPTYLTTKTSAAISTPFVAKSSKPHQLKWEDIEKLNFYKIKYHLVKQSTSRSNVSNVVINNDPIQEKQNDA